MKMLVKDRELWGDVLEEMLIYTSMLGESYVECLRRLGEHAYTKKRLSGNGEARLVRYLSEEVLSRIARKAEYQEAHKRMVSELLPEHRDTATRRVLRQLYNAFREQHGLDGRYQIRAEHMGERGVRYVVRFCGTYKSSSLTEAGALCNAHTLKQYEGM